MVVSNLKKNRGMTYIELIIVLSIFSVISGIVIFSYQEFQAKVDIKNLTNEIALKLVEAQKSSIAGKLALVAPTVVPWKPSYGVYFDVTAPNGFIYFADLDNSGDCNTPGCLPAFYLNQEVAEVSTITRNSSINSIEVSGAGCPATVQNLTVVFKRPNSSPIISFNPPITCVLDFVSIGVSSVNGKTAKIKVFPSGRIQIN